MQLAQTTMQCHVIILEMTGATYIVYQRDQTKEKTNRKNKQNKNNKSMENICNEQYKENKSKETKKTNVVPSCMGCNRSFVTDNY